MGRGGGRGHVSINFYVTDNHHITITDPITSILSLFFLSVRVLSLLLFQTIRFCSNPTYTLKLSGAATNLPTASSSYDDIYFYSLEKEMNMNK